MRFDRPLLGDVTGLTGIHLQCHIGTDTVSLARLGARMTGLDLSPASLEQARRLATDAGADIDYVEADTYSAPQALRGRTFDLVYTGIGALCWLPDIDRWAGVVDDLLVPGGRLFVREGHPMMWAVDETRTDGLTIGYPYFETPEPMDIEEEGTYVENDHVFVNTRQLSWNHGIGEILTALLNRGFEVTGFVEHRSVPWDALPGRMVVDGELDEWRLVDEADRLPLTYTLQARKPVLLGTVAGPAARGSARRRRPRARRCRGRSRVPPASVASTSNPRRRPSTERTTATTVTASPTALGARCSRATAVPTLDDPGGSRPSSARQVAASHQASSRGRAEHRQRAGPERERRVVIRHHGDDDAPVTHVGLHADHRMPGRARRGR